jgi:hypothetical protein
MPELSLDDIDIMVRNQEEEEEKERLEQEEQERLTRERQEKEILTRERQEKEEQLRLDKEKEEHIEKEEQERLTRERQDQERLTREKEEREKETKNVIMDTEVNKKNKPESKNSEIMVKKQESSIKTPTISSVPSITPVEINERSLYGADLNFDEEINLLDDDISFDPPKKSTIMPSSETKYTFFN